MAVAVLPKSGGGGGGGGDATELQGTPIAATPPLTGEPLVYDGADWAPLAVVRLQDDAGSGVIAVDGANARIEVGDTPASIGEIRTSPNTVKLAVRNVLDTDDVVLVDVAADLLYVGAKSDGTKSTDTVTYQAATEHRIDVAGARKATYSAGLVQWGAGVSMAFAGTVAAAGLIRVPNATTAVAARNATNNGDIEALKTDAANNVILNAGLGGGVIMQSNGSGVFGAVFGGLETYAHPVLLGAGNRAASGSLRAPNNSTIIAARNAFNTADIAIIGTNASDEILIGGAVYTAASTLWSTRGSMTRSGDTDALTADSAEHVLDDWDGTSSTAATGVTESKAAGTWTIVTTGTYRVSGVCYFAASGGGDYMRTDVWIAVDGTLQQGTDDHILIDPNGYTNSGFQKYVFDSILDLTAGQVVSIRYLMIPDAATATCPRAKFNIQRVA